MKDKYRIYGKSNYDKRFRPLDCHLGTFTSNLMYASVFDSKEQADDLCDYLNKNNEGMTFEVRKAV